MIVFEVRFGEIPKEMRLADMVELAVHGALEQSEERFDRVGMVEAAGADIFVSRVVDSA
jgi:hypothetical protein